MKELLLLLCCYPFEEKNRESLSILIREVKDWRETVKLINNHGIIALAAYNIKEAGLEKEIPESAMSVLTNGQILSMVRNTWLTERWKEVNTVLCNAGIKHILLKGMALEHTLYGGKGLRQMNDNDILVKRDDALKAWHLLQKEGFSHKEIKSPIHRKMLTDIGKHLPTLYKKGYEIEIHHKLFETGRGVERGEWGESEIFENAEVIYIGNIKTLILSEKMHLKYLISHYEKHSQEGSCQLRLYADIILLDKKSPVSIPDHFITDPAQEHKREYRKTAYRANIFSINPKFRLQYLIGDIFPSVEWMKKRYGCSGMRAMLYYPKRIGKLLWLV
jgi:hypothetical protein